jgi:hypothetical protein
MEARTEWYQQADLEENIEPFGGPFIDMHQDQPYSSITEKTVDDLVKKLCLKSRTDFLHLYTKLMR